MTDDSKFVSSSHLAACEHYSKFIQNYRFRSNDNGNNKHPCSHLSIKSNPLNGEYDISLNGDIMSDGDIIIDPLTIDGFKLINNVTFNGCSKDGEITGVITGVCWDWVYRDKPFAQYVIEMHVVNGKIVRLDIGDRFNHGIIISIKMSVVYDHIHSRYINREWLGSVVVVKGDLFDHMKKELYQYTTHEQRRLAENDKIQ